MNRNQGDSKTDSVDNDDIQLDTRGRRPAFFEAAEVDALMTALLETMSQLWATRSQVHTLEQILLDKAIVTAEELERFELPERQKEKDRQSMQEFFKDAFRALGAEFQSIDNRQKEIDKFQAYKAGEEKH